MNPSDPFDEGLVYQAHLGLAWRPYSEAQDPDPEALNLSNEQTLRLLAAVEEFYPEAGEEHSQSHELARLESKLNLVLELLGQLLAAQSRVPTTRAVRLNAHAVAWEPSGEEERPEPGARLLVDAYLSPEVPRPLRLLARALEREGSEAAGVTAIVETPSEQVVDLLEKFIFRRHRRAIAHSRPKARGS